MPQQKRPNEFALLVLGGSVAEDFAVTTNALEDTLNEEYVSPSGLPWKVYNGAISGGRHPMQSIAFLLMHDRVDAVISIEGWNEFSMGNRFGAPNEFWIDKVAKPSQSNDVLLSQLASSRLYRFFNHSTIFSNSYTAFLLGSSIMLLARENQTPSTEKELRNPFEDYSTNANLDKAAKEELFWQRYRASLMAIQSIASQHGIKSAFFVQPISTRQKKVPTENQAHFQIRNRAPYGYETFASRLLNLHQEGLPIFSLLDMFAEIPENVFSDLVHLHDSGMLIMARTIVETLGNAWHLSRKRHSPNSLTDQSTTPQ